MATVSLEPLSAVLRIGGTYGEPYHSACTVRYLSPTRVELVGMVGAPSLRDLRAVFDLFARQGVERIGWYRMTADDQGGYQKRWHEKRTKRRIDLDGLGAHGVRPGESGDTAMSNKDTHAVRHGKHVAGLNRRGLKVGKLALDAHHAHAPGSIEAAKAAFDASYPELMDELIYETNDTAFTPEERLANIREQAEMNKRSGGAQLKAVVFDGNGPAANAKLL